jgi:hypothetical protein
MRNAVAAWKEYGWRDHHASVLLAFEVMRNVVAACKEYGWGDHHASVLLAFEVMRNAVAPALACGHVELENAFDSLVYAAATLGLSGKNDL